MSVLVTMRVKVHDFEGTKAAVAKYGAAMKRAGCHWAKVYRAEKDPNDVLWLMEWESHAAFDASGDEHGDAVNALVQPAGEWDDVVWHLSDAAEIK
ncbi:MAG TPA: antibiotic biosynthesis monooxygenase [Anaerolineae bacterium]|nr:antibiotic biosynthesis monooxygenase [Anaerolineae bacterium]